MHCTSILATYTWDAPPNYKDNSWKTVTFMTPTTLRKGTQSVSDHQRGASKHHSVQGVLEWPAVGHSHRQIWNLKIRETIDLKICLRSSICNVSSQFLQNGDVQPACWDKVQGQMLDATLATKHLQCNNIVIWMGICLLPMRVRKQHPHLVRLAGYQNTHPTLTVYIGLYLCCK